MKKIIYLSLLLIIAVSCKKYSQDSSYSTYTPEGRLTTGSGWMCSMYKNEYGQEIKLPNGNFYFYLKFDTQLSIKYFDNTYNIIDTKLSKVTEKIIDWNFTDKKSKIEIDSIGVFSIEKLMVDKMILKSTKGELFYFDKKPFDEQSIDKTFTGNSFLNVITGNILSYADYYNDCKNLSKFILKKYTKYIRNSNFYVITEKDVTMETYIENNINAVGYLDIDSKLDKNKYEQVKTFNLSFSFNNTNGNNLTFNIYDLKSQAPKGPVYSGGFEFGPWLENSSNTFLKINGNNYTAECLIEEDSVFIKNGNNYYSDKKLYYTWKKIIVKNIPKGIITIELNPKLREYLVGDPYRGLLDSDFLISEIRTLK
jgi:hypothetical protein